MKLLRFFLIAGWSMLFANIGLAQPLPNKNARTPAQRTNAAGAPRYSLLNVNNLSTWMRSDGYSNHSPTTNNGTYFPRGTSWVIYQDGIMWGGKAYTDAAMTQPAPFNQLVRVGGANYLVGTREGRVLGSGAAAIPEDPASPAARMYRLRRDYFTMPEAELQRDAAEFYEIPTSVVTPAQMQAVRDQYERDWNEWPVAFGAPFIDRNHNGVYDAPPPFSANFTVDDLIRGGYDEPGLAGADQNLPADQVMWTVFNDLSNAQTLLLQGSEPLGLEAQVTMWAYKNAGALHDTFFRRIRLLNKGGVAIDAANNKGAFWIDSMYVAQWADPDLGNLLDDLTGCAPALGAGYVYNAAEVDAEFRQFNLPPPAVGYDLVQGPLVSSPGATAIFDFQLRNGFANLPLTAFDYFAPGANFSDPARNYSGTITWYKLLRGFAPILGPDQRYPFPPGVTPTPFPLDGDPVSDSGFLDGEGNSYSLLRGDRRFVMPSGPFRFAPGDTQEVVIAVVNGLGADRLSSISAMRFNLYAVQGFYERLLAMPSPPSFAASVSYPSAALAEIKITAAAQNVNAVAITVALKQPDGAQVTESALFDDGAHGDGAANDGQFANSLTITRKPVGLYLDASVTDNLQITQTFERVLDNITTAGPLVLEDAEIFSDNLNNDRHANPGENVRYGFTVRNQTAFDLAKLRLSPLVEYEIGKTLVVPDLGAGLAFPLAYYENDPNSFFSFEVPSGYAEAAFHIPFFVTDAQNNLWQDTLTFAIAPGPGPFIEVELQHLTGTADGNFFLRIIDRQALKNNEYHVIGVDSIDVLRNLGITLKNVTTNEILLATHPLPDSLGHNMPLIDGFKILRGTIPNQNKLGMKNWSVPSGVRTWTFSNASDLGLEGFFGAMGWSSPRRLFGDGVQIVPARAIRNTLIRFAQTDTSGNVLNANDANWSFAYRYGRAFAGPPAQPEFAPFIVNPSGGYAYQDFTKSAPFSAWDMETTPPRRLAIGFLENNVAGGMVDGKYWPPLSSRASNTASSGPREWFFIFDVAYSETPEASLMQEMISGSQPVMWMGTPARRGDGAFHAGDEFLIEKWHPVTSQDVWSFNPVVLGVAENAGPITFSLAQNYPNPFARRLAEATHLAFSLPLAAQVRLRVFNVLGQEVITLVDKKLAPGKYVEAWQGKDHFGRAVASGVYFYRLEVKAPNGNAAPRFVRTQKMLVLH